MPSYHTMTASPSTFSWQKCSTKQALRHGEAIWSKSWKRRSGERNRRKRKLNVNTWASSIYKVSHLKRRSRKKRSRLNVSKNSPSLTAVTKIKIHLKTLKLSLRRVIIRVSRAKHKTKAIKLNQKPCHPKNSERKQLDACLSFRTSSLSI